VLIAVSGWYRLPQIADPIIDFIQDGLRREVRDMRERDQLDELTRRQPITLVVPDFD
jgi:hypothetical protein